VITAESFFGGTKTSAIFGSSLHPAADFSPNRRRWPSVRPEQLGFGALDPLWNAPARPGRWHRSPYLSDCVRSELKELEQIALEQGRVTPNAAWTYRNGMTMNAKIAGRLLGRPLSSLREIYEPELLERVLRYDGPIDGDEGQQSAWTVKTRRTPLRQYPRIVRVPGLDYMEVKQLVDRTLRRISRRRGYCYRLPKLGRPYVIRYVPAREDVFKVVAVLLGNDRSFIGPRNALALALMYYHGCRSDSVLGIKSQHVSWRHSQLFLMIHEKWKPGRREIEADPEVARLLRIYVARFNGYAAERRGVCQQIEPGTAGTFWFAEDGTGIKYEALRHAVYEAALVAGVRPFQLHAVRHLFGRELGNDLPLIDAARAGGWRSSDAYLRVYANDPPLDSDLQPPRKEERSDAPLPKRPTVAPLRRAADRRGGQRPVGAPARSRAADSSVSHGVGKGRETDEENRRANGLVTTVPLSPIPEDRWPEDAA
jgi:integrase